MFLRNAFVSSIAVVLFLAAGLKSATQWKEASPGYVFSFPNDHASHPDYKIEWWYYTGNVSTRDGRRFGYQVTFFRVGVDAAPANPSRWAIRDLFMTHLAVSDPKGRRYRYAEKLTRGGPGLAGAEVDRYHVWNEDWTASLDDSGRHVLQAHPSTRAGLREPQAAARSGQGGDGVGIDLVLDPGKPPAINGVNGISQKGEQAGNASHYYSMTRMPTRGTITVDGERFEVSGLTWMDHEFGTSFLEPGQRGWDWLSIQLADGRELMLYQLRRSDGSRDPRSSGTVVAADGRTPTSPPAIFHSRPDDVLSAPQTVPSTPSSGRSRFRRRRSTWRSRRRSTTRSSTSAAAPGSPIGKARSMSPDEAPVRMSADAATSR